MRPRVRELLRLVAAQDAVHDDEILAVKGMLAQIQAEGSEDELGCTLPEAEVTEALDLRVFI